MQTTNPSIFVIDSNFFIALKETNHMDIIDCLKEIAEKLNYKFYAPHGVYDELQSRDTHMGILLKKIAEIVSVEQDELYRYVKDIATRYNYISVDEIVDIEVISLEKGLSKEKPVGIITFDVGIANTINDKHLKSDKLCVIYPTSFLLKFVTYAPNSLKNKLKVASHDMLKYFSEYRLKKKRSLDDLIEDLINITVEFADLSARELEIIERGKYSALIKYLTGEALTPLERTTIQKYIPVLDKTKKVMNMENPADIERALFELNSDLILLNKQLDPMELTILISVIAQMTARKRFSLILTHLRQNKLDKAIAQIETLRIMSLFQKHEGYKQFIARAHLILGLLQFLKQQYDAAFNCLSIAEKLVPLDTHGEILKLLLYITTQQYSNAEEILKSITSEENPLIFNLLADFAHKFVLQRQYNIAAKTLNIASKCKYVDKKLLTEKVLVLLRSNHDLDKKTIEELQNYLDPSMLVEHTNKPIDKKFLSDKPISVGNLHQAFKETMPVIEAYTMNQDQALFVMWNYALRSRIGLIVPMSFISNIDNVFSVKIVDGMITKTKKPSVSEKNKFKVRVIIVASKNISLEFERWKFMM